MRILGAAVVGLALAAGVARSAPGYLALVGPPPLRFQQPPAVRSPVAPVALPIHPLTQEPQPVSVASPTPPATLEPPAGSNDASLATNIVTQASQKPQEPVRTSDTAVPSTNAPIVITPQMLMQFFVDRSLTNQEIRGVTPVPFLPALPPLPSSSATYISDPKQ